MTVVALVVAVLGLALLLHGLRGIVFADQWQAQVGEGLLAAVGILILVSGLISAMGL